MRSLQREQVHPPANGDGGHDQAGQHSGTELELTGRILAHQRGEHRGDARGEDDQQHEMTLEHYFLPIKMSYASIATSVFSSPATTRNVLPYSYVTATTLPLP